jgi:hypothetical protein
MLITDGEGFYHRAVQQETLNKGQGVEGRTQPPGGHFQVINALGKVQLCKGIYNSPVGHSKSRPFPKQVFFKTFSLSVIQHSTQEICFLTEEPVRRLLLIYDLFISHADQNPSILY